VRVQSPVRRRSRRAQPSGVAGLWLAISAICTLLAFVVESLTMMVVCIVVAVLSAVVGCVALFAPERAGVPATSRRGQPAGKRAPASDRARPAGTPAPVGAARPCGCRAGRRCPGAEKCQCARCQGRRRAARRPAEDHRAWLVGPEAKRVERRVVRDEQRRRAGG
jgi:hypothetical protein